MKVLAFEKWKIDTILIYSWSFNPDIEVLSLNAVYKLVKISFILFFSFIGDDKDKSFKSMKLSQKLLKPLNIQILNKADIEYHLLEIGTLYWLW